MQGLTVGANPSTTAASNTARSKTQIASIITALILMITLLTRVDLFSFLPQAVVAVAVIVSVSHLLNPGEFRRLYRLRKIDFVLAMVALVGVFTAGILPGLMIAVFLSLLIVLYRSSQPHLAELGKIPGHLAYGDIDENPDAEQIPGLLIVRPDAPLFFANANTLHSQIRRLVSIATKSPKALILDLGASDDLDVASTDMLKSLIIELQELDIPILLADVKSITRTRLEHTGLIERIGEANVRGGGREAVNDLADGKRSRLGIGN